MCGAHPRAVRSSGASHPISAQTLTAIIEQLLERRPFLVYGGLLFFIPMVFLFGMSVMVMLSAVVVPLLIPLVAVAGVRVSLISCTYTMRRANHISFQVNY